MLHRAQQPSINLSRRAFLGSLAVAGGTALFSRRARALNPFELLQTAAPLKRHDDGNAEPNLVRLVQSWVTPTEHFYIRSHGATPMLDAATHRLKVTGLVDRELSLSLADITSQFGQRSALATLQCAGNRRDEFIAMRPVKGVPWGPGAIGNADWTGVSLGAILDAAGLKDSAKHVEFIGSDPIDSKGHVEPFGCSIPIEKARAEETLLAYAMNGEALGPEHGYPLRALVPGYFGVRSVKWLATINVSAEPSQNHFHHQAYKIFPSSVDDTNVDWDSAPPLQEMIVNSVIGTIDLGTSSARVTGYAMATGAKGDALAKVELSPDGGSTWQPAAFTSPEHPYCWRLWEATIPLTKDTKAITVRATTRNGATQSPTIDWNFKGYGFNAYYTREI